ncbi:MAG: HAD family hydrolase [Tenericutes bacterium]|jgi:phosphoglycolate phosphatase|nr:HAD family hydrolase [Mycoplasmatota bacterium]
MIKAVIFDLDGTLLDTIEDIANTCNIVLEKRGYKTLPLKDYRQYVGKGVKHLIEKMMEASQIEKYLFDEIINDYFNVYKNESTKMTKIYPGMVPLLENLKEMGISLNVLSNKPHNQVKDLMPTYFEDNLFNIVYGKHDNLPAKPNPTLIRKMIKELKVKSTEILYVGDTKTDMETALNAGLASVGVLWGFRDEPELVQAKASYIVSSPNEIAKIIKEKNQ